MKKETNSFQSSEDFIQDGWSTALIIGVKQASLADWSKMLLLAYYGDTRMFDHITPILALIYWFPVRFRINFKIVFKALNGSAPQYIFVTQMWNWLVLEIKNGPRPVYF